MEYKFRVWDKDLNMMSYSNDDLLVMFLGNDICVAYDNPAGDGEVKNYELMQYVGIKDINGVEIYEGDILKCKLYNDRYENYKVHWNEKEGMFEALNKFNTNFIDYTMWNEFEIVGNLYENPELMEG